MATCIYLEQLKPSQENVDSCIWDMELNEFRGQGDVAIIAKGNVIEGIEAKW